VNNANCSNLCVCTLVYNSKWYTFVRAGIAPWCSAGLRIGWSGVLVPVGAGKWLALGPNKLPIQWVRGALSLGVKRPGTMLTTYIHLVSRSRMHGAVPPLPIHLYGVVVS